MKPPRRKKFRVLDCKPCGEQSPYWKWLELHSINSEGDILEPAEANPDVLPVLEDLPTVQSEKDAIHEGWLRLTNREKEVLTLLSSGKTFDDVAMVFHVSKQAIWCCFKTARNKILKELEKINDQR